ncbi:MAG: glycosyl hydrolase, partial [Chitinophagia bacterium]|nr:glycosyl hydrolase [Chitinophagia bacterium]
MKKRCLLFFLFVGIGFQGMTQDVFAKGADVSWLPQMEASGYVFKDKEGKPNDCLKILKSLGMNTIRLRVFVNPN